VATGSLISLVAAVALAFAQAATAAAPPVLTLADDAEHTDPAFPGRNARLFVLSDIGNEPDDQMSMVRLVLYSNDIDIEGLVATTSTWQTDELHPEVIHRVLDAYGEVRGNLLKHSPRWPTAEELKSRVSSGLPAYGMAAIGRKELSSGATALIAAAKRRDDRPLWISIWGGANTLAEALDHLRKTHSPEATAQILARLRVTSISDQDDAGPWIRREFPRLVYVVKPSPPDSDEYASATWTGISGDQYYRNCAGAETLLVSDYWLDENIRRKGPLGARYPRNEYIMEGDTPAFLALVKNGLEAQRSPGWGGWGGRYVHRQPYGEMRPIWTQGGDVYTRVTSADTVIGLDGQNYTSDQATIWRWRRAMQHEFAARMNWTVSDFTGANHAPVIAVNGRALRTTHVATAYVNKPLTIDLAGSRDPDGHGLSFHWYHYPEAGTPPLIRLADVDISGADSARATITPTETCRQNWTGGKRSCPRGVAHIIVEATDDGSPALTTYQRIILHVLPAKR
jgi:hypothetical protein